MGVASLVLGIVGLVFSFIPCLGSWGIFLTVPGIVLGAIGLASASKKNAPKGLAIAGLVCSIIGSIIAGYQYYVLHKATDAVTEFTKAVNEAAKDANEINKKASDFSKELDDKAKKVQEGIDAVNKAAEDFSKSRP